MKSPALARPALMLFAVAAVAVLPGCATHEVKVDAISRQKLALGHSASYQLHSSNPTTAEESLRFQEAAGRIKTALSGRGLWEAPNPKSADLIVEVDYSIEPPKEAKERYEVPVFGQLGEMSSEGIIIRGPSRTDTPAESGDSMLVGYAERERCVFIREKRMLVTCRENRPDTDHRPPPELWRVSASIETPCTDLRDCLPLLATAIMKQIGETTEGETTESIDASDHDIEFIKKGL